MTLERLEPEVLQAIADNEDEFILDRIEALIVLYHKASSDNDLNSILDQIHTLTEEEV